MSLPSSAPQPSPHLSPRLRLVANGLSNGTLKATIIVSPSFDDSSKFDLSKWPSQAFDWLHAQLFGPNPSASIYLSPIVTGNQLAADQRVPLRCKPTPKPDVKDGAILNAFWSACFGTSVDWSRLADELKAALECNKDTPALSAEFTPGDDPPDARFFDETGAIFAEVPSGGAPPIGGVLSVRYADSGVDEERRRAIRVGRKLEAGPNACPATPDVADAPGAPSVFETSGFKVKLRKKLWDRYRQAVKDTEGDRAKNKRAFDDLRKLLDRADAPCVELDYRTGDALPISKKVTDEPLSISERASHVLATWLQKSRVVEKPGPAPSTAPPVTSNEDSGAWRAVFHALQDDPLLSRAFCLAVDVELDPPARFTVTDKRQFVHLWVASTAPIGAPGSLNGIVATAASLHKQGFWPASVFECGLPTSPGQPLSCQESLVEQSDGVWNLGQGAAQATEFPEREARFDLSSMDIRRALESKGDRPDRGERQLTAGFTVLDRGRSFQILREIALASRGGKCGTDPLILYAEDLTVGRKVDIAAVAPGSPIDLLEWRSLMKRFARYDLDVDRKGAPSRTGTAKSRLGAIARVLSRPELLRGERMGAEGSFQVNARHVPRVRTSETDDPPWDVAADEAIYTWDGTPAGVLTDRGEETADAPDLSLPFQRSYSLPTTREGKGCPPPLRYGVPYVFGMRSVFVGGGSPTLADATRVHRNTQGRQALPAFRKARTDDGKPNPNVAAPRRFLRHEGLSAPTALLPEHLATYRYGVMGFEQLDQAFVRSVHAAEKHPGRVLPPPSDPYFPLTLRDNPDKTMRVFVAPEASFTDVVRHGNLDGRDSLMVLAGGLRTVGREHVDRCAVGTDPAIKVTRFPYVVTEQYQAINGAAVYHRRRAGQGEQTSGVPVFHPGGRRDVPVGEVGWLPEPAARSFSVRARIRGSQRYLDGHLAAELYEPREGISYPNALPLVLDIRSKPGRRKDSKGQTKVATNIAELVDGGPEAPLAWIDAAGHVGPQRGTTRVRCLRLALHEAEDYDLEVACLPSIDVLASAFSLPETIAVQRLVAAWSKDARDALVASCGITSEKIDECKSAKHQPLTGIGGFPVPDANLITRCAKELIETMQTRWPVEEVASITKLRVCHAVNRPLSSPSCLEVIPRRPVPPEGLNHVDKDEAGSTVLLLTKQISLDLQEIDSFEVLVETTSTGGSLLDDPARSRSLISRRSGRWPTYTASDGKRKLVPANGIYGFSIRPNGRVEFQREEVVLLRVDNLPTAAAVGALVRPQDIIPACVKGPSGPNPIFELMGSGLSKVDLGMLHAAAMTKTDVVMLDARPDLAEDRTGGRRSLRVAAPSSISDTRARLLKIRVRGMSRSAEAFETAAVYIDGTEPLLRRRQALSSPDQSILSSPNEVWSPATERPAACQPLRPEPTFVFERRAESDGCGGIIHGITRRVATRLYFKRGWFSSGEGERLGIVLWPPNYFDTKQHDIERDSVTFNGRRISIAGFDDKDLGSGGAYITRWGGDPIRKDERPQCATLIPVQAFADVPDAIGGGQPCPRSVHEPHVVSVAQMPVPREEGNTKDAKVEFLPVSLVTYEPCFDADREEWYVDVDLRSWRPSEPFIRFGLVRYQPNAINDDVRVSNPVTVNVQLLAPRQLTARVPVADRSRRRQIELTMAGPGSSGIKDIDWSALQLPPDTAKGVANSFAQLQRPWMRVWMSHEYRDGRGVLHRVPLDPGDTTKPKEAQAIVENDQLAWRLAVELQVDTDMSQDGGCVVVYVEEVDRRMPAAYPGAEPIAPDTLFDPATFVDSGPRFSASIPLFDIDMH